MRMEFTLKYIINSILLVFALSSVANAAPSRMNTTDTEPATCTVGDLWIDTNGTAGNSVYTCTAANTWTLLDTRHWVAQTTAPADTTLLWFDTDQVAEYVVLKVYTGGKWVPHAVGSSGSYTLPTAAADTLGGVKVGSRLTITNGILSADVQTTDISGKQDVLVSGTNIKTINSTSLLGSGNIAISGSATYPSAAGVANWGGSAWGTSLVADGDAIGELIVIHDDGEGNAALPFTISYTDLTDKPTIPADVGDLTDTGGLLGGSVDSLDDLSDVTLGTPSNGQVLKFNGSIWAPAADSTAAGAGYVSTPPTYSDEACTAGQYAFSASTGYVCVSSGDWNTFSLTDWNNPTPADTTPAAFTFGDTQTDAALSTQYCSAAVTPTGYDAAATVEATGTATGLGWKVNGGSFVTSGTLSPGQTISVCGTSSASNSTSTTASVTVGGVTATAPFTITTVDGVAGISDNFSGTLANWTTRAGTFTTASGELSCSETGIVEYTASAPSSADQWVKVKFAATSSGEHGVVLRAPNGTGYRYVIYHNDPEWRWEWQSRDDNNVLGYPWKVNAVDQSDNTLTEESVSGQTWGFTITGTGNNTRVRLWKNPTAASPINATSWDATDDWDGIMIPTETPGAMTDTYVGVKGVASSTYDDFSAGAL